MGSKQNVEKKSWLRRRAEGAFRTGLTRAYETVRVDPERFLFQLRAAYGLPIVTYHGVYSVEMSRLDDVAESVIRSGMKLDRKSTRLNSSHLGISYAVFCL